MMANIKTTEPVSDEVLYGALKKYFGFNEFKGTQKEVIRSILSRSEERRVGKEFRSRWSPYQ